MPNLSLSLSLSLTHTHTCDCCRADGCTSGCAVAAPRFVGETQDARGASSTSPTEISGQRDAERGRNGAEASASIDEREPEEGKARRARVDGGERVYIRVAAMVATGALIGVVYMRSRARG